MCSEYMQQRSTVMSKKFATWVKMFFFAMKNKMKIAIKIMGFLIDVP